MAQKKVTAFICLGLVILGIIFVPGYLKIRRLARRNRQLEAQIKEITQTNKMLEQQQQRLLNDPVYLEEVARKKLGVARKGEVIYKVVPQEQNQ